MSFAKERPLALSLQPTHHLEHEVDADGATHWSAVGVDPQFRVSHAGGERFAAGWYLLEMDLRVEEGYLDNPCFYPDYGRGSGDATRVPIARPEAGEGVVRTVVRFDHDALQLRFDPSTAPCVFVVRDIRLTPLGKFAAAWRMLRRLMQRVLAQHSLLGVAVADMGDAVRTGGVRGFGEWLYRFHEAHDIGVSLDYQSWIQRFDTLNDGDLRQMRDRAVTFRHKPLISVLVPVYNTPETWLRRCIDSVLAQAYPHWQLCLADDASTQPHVARVLAEYAARDARIAVVSRPRNGHISEASNSAIGIATGEYFALLDHDDELAPHALYLMAKAVNEKPGLKLVYSDEDKLDEKGVRFDPYFKPDWNPDLFLSHNVVCHLTLYDAAMVRELGGFRRGYEGSQDYDLALRCVARLRADEIGHVPHVLYHWRAIAGSTALSGGEKSYAEDAGRRALEDHLAEAGEHGAEVSAVTGGYRIRHPLRGAPLVSLIIPTRDRLDLLQRCIDSILAKTTYRNFEILVVDNQSSEPETLAYFDSLAGREDVRILPYDAPFNYSRLNNFAAAQARGEVIGLVNNDVEVIEGGWLEEMASHAMRPGNGAVGAMLYYPDDRIQHAGVIIGLGGVAGHAYTAMPKGFPGQHHRAQLTQNLSAVTAACLLVRKDVFDEVGGLDESLEVAFNDIDFCLRIAAAGYRNVWTPWAELYHYESATRGYEDNPVKKARFDGEVARMQARWGRSLLWDPAYSPNLGVNGHNFPLAIPPRLPMRESLRGGRAVLVHAPGADSARHGVPAGGAAAPSR